MNNKNYEEKFYYWLKQKHGETGYPRSVIDAINVLSKKLNKEIFSTTEIQYLENLYIDLLDKQKDPNSIYFSKEKPSYGNNHYFSASINKYKDFLVSEEFLKPTADKEFLKQKINYIKKQKKINLKPLGNKNPSIKEVKQKIIERDPQVIVAVKSMANGKCENCCKNAPFFKKDNDPYLEVHHIKRLADKGSDTINNAVAVCPNCHKALHYAKNADELASELYKKIDRLIRE